MELIPPRGHAPSYKHGYATKKNCAPEYTTWTHMRGRCNNPKDIAYPHYGGRGIRVSARWEADFLNFIEDMGRKPSPSRTIDRIDNDGDYSPENCRWATKLEQGRNRRANRFIEYNGSTRTLTEWAAVIGIAPHTLHARFQNGWPLDAALSLPKGSRPFFRRS